MSEIEFPRDVYWSLIIKCDPTYDHDRYFDGEPGCVYESGQGLFYAPGEPDLYWHKHEMYELVDELGPLPEGHTWHVIRTPDSGETWEEVDSGPK